MALRLSAADGAAYIDALQRGLRALRLNRHYPDWKAVRDHLDGVARLPPGADLAVDDASGWPHPEEWLRVRVDQRLAPELIGRLRPLADAGDAHARQKLAYLEAISASTVIGEGAVSVGLIEQGEQTSRYEIVVDRVELGRPVFVRWTLRLGEAGDRLSPDALASKASDHFERRLRRLATQDAVAAMLLLQAEPGLTVEEIVRGEIGPIRRAADGAVQVSAVLSRAAPHLRRTSVDDVLSANMTIPNEDAGFGLSHHRKWAVPRASLSAFKAELRARGARNLAYGY